MMRSDDVAAADRVEAVLRVCRRRRRAKRILSRGGADLHKDSFERVAGRWP